MNEYVLSLDGEYFQGDKYESREAAVAKGLKEAQMYNADNTYDVSGTLGYEPGEKIQKFYVGRVAQTDMDYDTAADDVIDEVRDHVEAQLGEFAEGYLDDVTEADRKELVGLIEVWFKRHGYLPGGFVVEDTREYQVPVKEGESNADQIG